MEYITTTTTTITTTTSSTLPTQYQRQVPLKVSPHPSDKYFIRIFVVLYILMILFQAVTARIPSRSATTTRTVFSSSSSSSAPVHIIGQNIDMPFILKKCSTIHQSLRLSSRTLPRQQRQRQRLHHLSQTYQLSTRSSSSAAFIIHSNKQFQNSKRQQQHSSSSQQHDPKMHIWSPHLRTVAAISLVTASILHNDSQPDKPFRYSTTYTARRAMALCDTIDPNESININNKVGATTPPILTSPRTDNTLPSPIPQSTSLALQQELLFSPACLEYDHYNGVTIDLECIINDYNNDDDRLDTASTFQERLQHQLQIWKAEGIIRGVWIHIPPRLAAYVPACIENGFDFHMVTPATGTMTNDTADKSNDGMATSKSNVLILSQWLPNTTSRLPIGPTHQVGVGCLIWHPDDPPTLGPQRRLLVVQEKSGPAATFQLWKLPTGLADPNEDIHDAAIRELYEETGLVGHFDGLLLVRQAHPNVATTGTVASAASNASATTLIEEINTKRSPKKSAVQRKVSDLFFICQMTLQQQQQQQQQQHSSPEHANKESKDVGINTPIWTACPNEIAAIQWMSVQDYCQQQRWQSSPLYMMLNRVIMEAASTTSSPVESNLSDDLNSMKGPVCMTTTKTPLWNETTLPVWVDNKNTTSSSIGGDNPNAASKYTNTFYSIK